MNLIGDDPKFYGYIIGLQVERSPSSDIGRKLFATFEYSGEVSVWQVPDCALFDLLADHLMSMAFSRKETDDYGDDKLWIGKREGQWITELP